MKTVIFETYEQMCKFASDIICDVVRAKPDAVLGLATGSTSIGVYKEMCKQFGNGLSFAKTRTVNLDEYVGLRPDHDQSYAYFMRAHLFDKVNLEKNNTFLPCGTAPDLEAECARYNALLDRLPRDVQLLGLGSDGHIAFNEPGSPFDSRTRVVELASGTIKDNSRLFDRLDDVPRFAVSMGIADIMSAAKVVLLANGKHKAQAVKAMLTGKVDPSCPAGVLQLHKDATVILDKEAACLLQ